MPAFRVELHNHCDCDTQDSLDYSARDLVNACVRHGVDVLAITPHREVFHDPETVAYARSRGILLIPGVEKMVEGRELVLLNVLPDEIPHRMARADLERLRQQKGDNLLVLAPHPFYPRQTCVGPVLDRFAHCIDVIEWCHLYLKIYNPNQPASLWAAEHGKPVIVTSDTHNLDHFARNRAEVEADTLETESLFRAIRLGKIRNQHRPLNTPELVRFIFQGMLALAWHRFCARIAALFAR